MTSRILGVFALSTALLFPIWLGLTTSSSSADAEETHTLPHPEIWWKGSVEDALKESKATKRPLFIYWGAQWCPPCNELKAEIFSRKEFPALIAAFIPLAIDGDSDDAQKWGERLGAVGYPTMLVVAPGDKVKMRIVGSLSWNSFLIEIKKADNKKQPSRKTDDEDTATALGKLNRTRTASVTEGARLATIVLVGAPDAPAKLADKIRQNWSGFFSLISATPEGRQQGELLLLEGRQTLSWIVKSDTSPELKKERVMAWSAALDNLEKDAGATLTSKVKITAARCELLHVDALSGFDPVMLRGTVDDLVAKVLASGDEYLIKSLLPSLADAYASLGDQKAALDLLQNNIAKTDTPWYFYSHMAWLVADGGDKNGAVTWSEKAAQAATGNSTRLQVLASYMKTVSESAVSDKGARIASALREFLNLAASSPDAFYNRNKRSLENASALAKDIIKKDGALRADIKSLKTKCPGLTAKPSAKACAKYFDRLTRGR